MRALKWILVIGVVVCLAILGWQHRQALKPEMVRDWIWRFGALAPFVYILLYAAAAVSAVPPVIAALSLTSGLAFGPWIGFAALLTGAMLGCSAAFALSRSFGRRFVEKLLKGKFKALDEKLGSRGFPTVLFFRVVPLVPFEVLNYASGLSRIKYRDYALASVIGFIPGSAVAAGFGDALTEPLSRRFWITLAVFALLMAVPILYAKFRRRPNDGIDREDPAASA